MKKQKLLYSVLWILIMANSAYAEKNVSFGVGLGKFYGGLGGNIAVMDGHDMKYLAMGLTGLVFSDDDFDEGIFGVTAGWVRTDIIAPKSGRHGIGLFAAIDAGAGEASFSIGPSYTYFFRGMIKTGLNIGISTGISITEDDTSFLIAPQIGYQF